MIKKEQGFIGTPELLLVIVVVCIGLIVGLVTLRDSTMGELSDTAEAFGGLDQSHQINGAQNSQSSGAIAFQSWSDSDDTNAGDDVQWFFVNSGGLNGEAVANGDGDASGVGAIAAVAGAGPLLVGPLHTCTATGITGNLPGDVQLSLNLTIQGVNQGLTNIDSVVVGNSYQVNFTATYTVIGNPANNAVDNFSGTVTAINLFGGWGLDFAAAGFTSNLPLTDGTSDTYSSVPGSYRWRFRAAPIAINNLTC